MAKREKKEKIKVEKYRSEEQTEMIRFIRILIIVIILILGIYFFTRIFIAKDLLNKQAEENKTIEGSINYDITMIGSMLEKPEEEYYVLIYNTEDLRSVYYGGLISTYARNKNALKLYFADLNKELNKKFYDPENINLDGTNISDLKVGDLTLLKVKDGKIIESFTDEEKIASELAYIKPEDPES